LPETAKDAARAKGGERYDRFLEALGRGLAQGPKLRQEISEDVQSPAPNAPEQLGRMVHARAGA
jgi:hypothetical protein